MEENAKERTDLKNKNMIKKKEKRNSRKRIIRTMCVQKFGWRDGKIK